MSEHFHPLCFHLTNDFPSPGTGVEGSRHERGPSIRGDEWRPGPRLRTQHLLLIHLPFSKVRLFHQRLIWHGCSPNPQLGRHTKRCVGGGMGQRSGRSRWVEPASSQAMSGGCTFLAWMNPFISKSNPHCRVGETVVLICASAISSSLG